MPASAPVIIHLRFLDPRFGCIALPAIVKAHMDATGSSVLARLSAPSAQKQQMPAVMLQCCFNIPLPVCPFSAGWELRWMQALSLYAVLGLVMLKLALSRSPLRRVLQQTSRTPAVGMVMLMRALNEPLPLCCWHVGFLKGGSLPVMGV